MVDPSWQTCLESGVVCLVSEFAEEAMKKRLTLAKRLEFGLKEWKDGFEKTKDQSEKWLYLCQWEAQYADEAIGDRARCWVNKNNRKPWELNRVQ